MYIFINILVIIFFKIQKYLKQRIPQLLESCVIGKTMVQAKKSTWLSSASAAYYQAIGIF